MCTDADCLLQMLKHGARVCVCSILAVALCLLIALADVVDSMTGRAGVPMEVMGLMLGEFVDDYTVRVIDVFAMPQSGTVSHNHVSDNLNGSTNEPYFIVFHLTALFVALGCQCRGC